MVSDAAAEMTNEFWARFIILADRAGKFLMLMQECAPYMEQRARGESIDPAMEAKLDYCMRGMEHFGPFLDKFEEFFRIAGETTLDLVDKEILDFLDSLQ